MPVLGVYIFRDMYAERASNLYGSSWGWEPGPIEYLKLAFKDCFIGFNLGHKIEDIIDLNCWFEKMINLIEEPKCFYIADLMLLWNGFDPLNGLKTTDAEVSLVFQQTFGDCDCVIAMFFNMKLALERMKVNFPNQDNRNTCRDAFRHSFFNALNTLDCGEELAHDFGDAHEADQPMPYTNNTNMDFYNNEQGRLVALSDLTMDDEMTEDYICNWLAVGNMQILANPLIDTSQPISSVSCICP